MNMNHQYYDRSTATNHNTNTIEHNNHHNNSNERKPLLNSNIYHNNGDNLNQNHRNYSSGTIVTSNRSQDALQNTLYHPNDKHASHQRTKARPPGGKVAICTSIISIVLCLGVLISFLCVSSRTPSLAKNDLLPGIVRHPNDDDDDENSSSSSNSSNDTTMSILQQQIMYHQQYYDAMGRFVVEDYDNNIPLLHSMTVWLPGLVGIYGIPLYAEFSSSQQCLTRFGFTSPQVDPIQSQPPQHSTRGTTGFRTFLQIASSSSSSSSSLLRTDTPASSWTNVFRSWWSHSSDPDNDDDHRPVTIEPFSPWTARLSSSSNSDHDDSFHNNNPPFLPKRYLYIGWNMIQLQEIDVEQQIETNVTFFLLPEEDFGALVKHTTITNLRPPSSSSSRRRDNVIKISILDGLTNIVPAMEGGGEMGIMDDYRRTPSSVMSLKDYMIVDSPYVSNVNESDDDDETSLLQMPFYRLSMVPIREGNANSHDLAAAPTPTKGHWCLSIIDSSHSSNDDDDNDDDSNVPNLLPILYNPSIIFGNDVTFERPVRLQLNRLSDLLGTNRTEPTKGLNDNLRQGYVPSAFAVATDVTLRPGQSTAVTSFYGTANHILDVPVVARRLLQPGFVPFKLARANELGQQVTSSIESHTANPLWDGHVQQMLLDNSLLGGIPQIVGEDNDDSKLRCTDEDGRLKVLHLFSHIHGDIGKRDYGSVEIAPTFFSNGPGNFRDVVQSRRNDVFFNPRIGSFNVKTFLSFIQADGYEPLKVESILFKIDSIDDCIDIATQAVGEADGHRAQRTALTNILHSGMFRPGQLLHDMMQQNIDLVISRQEFIDIVTAVAKAYPTASFASGYWADHWTYYLDLIETYLSVYPDWMKRTFFETQLPYFWSPAHVQPRSKKYVLLEINSEKKYHVQQLNCTVADESEQQQQQQQQDSNRQLPDWGAYKMKWQHDENGSVFKSTTMEKLFLLVTVKFAARDPYGVGLLYEGGKPGWNDAMYGLVNSIGSGTPELYELYVLMKFVQSTIKKYEVDIDVPIELHRLVTSINAALDALQESGYVDGANLYPQVPPPLFDYWDTVTASLEVYRQQIEQTFIGKTRPIPCDDLDHFMNRWMRQIELGIERGRKLGTHGDGDDGNSGVPPTYFFYNVRSWTMTGENSVDGHALVVPREMEVHLLPLFLEGPTRMFKTISTREEAKALYNAVRSSPLRDTNLPMYTMSASLNGQPLSIGRAPALPRGYLENQSISLHMSYKFYLELLRHGLYQEFFTEMESGGMLPFFDPKVYGQSLMTATTFIVSSVYADPAMRGQGYNGGHPLQYSGTTSEFLSMWIILMIGPHPFSLHRTTGQLQLQFVPTIPVRWFTVGPDGTLLVRYKLFGSIAVTYYNTRGIDLFDIVPTRYVVTLLDGTIMEVQGPIIEDSDLADKIRRVVFVASLDVYF